MHWYLVYTKPKQERCALENLQRQGYQCYLPVLLSEKLCQGILKITEEPLFPRYLFIRLCKGDSAPSWTPIRSTRGVCRLVSFGTEPAKVTDLLVEALRAQEAFFQNEPLRLFRPGERVRLTQKPFVDIEGIYQIADGEHRVMVMIELLCKQVRVRVSAASVRKVA